MVSYLNEFKRVQKKSVLCTKRLKKGQFISSKSVNIKVVVRVRPINNKKNEKQIIDIIDDQTLIFDPLESIQPFFYHGLQLNHFNKTKKNIQFAYDKVFGFKATNEEIFKNTIRNLLDSLMDGYNCSIFAYGATSAGKTYTMLGSAENPGVIHLAIQELFKLKLKFSEERKLEFGITYLEIYNELVKNLLNPGHTLQLMEDEKYGVIVSGLKIEKIESINELIRLLELGNNNRTQHPTDVNAESSRSHAIFQIYIQMETKHTNEIRGVKLSMIDLAGSERGGATNFIGARFVEGANINKSLLALGNCINCLADGCRHIPYRNSKLTRLLKDCLGGNCQTLMIANISSSSFNYEDTYNTLKYATRAKKIKANMSKNIVTNIDSFDTNQYMKIVEDLKKEIQLLKMQVIENRIEQDESLDFTNLLNEHKKIVENISDIENTEQIIIWQRQLNEEAHDRIKFIKMDIPEIQDHFKFNYVAECFQNEDNIFKNELVDMKNLKTELERKITELLKRNSLLQNKFDMHSAQLTQIEYRYKADLAQKRVALLEIELNSRACLLVKMSKLLQPSLLQLHGRGFTTDRMMNDYQGIIRHLQNLKNTSWVDRNMNDLGNNSAVNNMVDSSPNYSLKYTEKSLPFLPKIFGKNIFTKNGVDFAYLNIVAGEIILSIILCTLLIFVKK